MDLQAMILSLKLSVMTTLLLLVLGLPFSYWLSVSRWKFKVLIECLVVLPLVLPPSVLGFYLLLAMGPQGPLGIFYTSMTGRFLPFSFEGLLLGSFIYSLPFAVQPFLAGFSAVDQALVEASWSLGASKRNTFRYVILPLCYPSVLTGVILSFAHTLGEFGMVMMIGGNIPGVTRTLSVSIYDDVQGMNYHSAAQTSVLLLGISMTGVVLTSLLKRKRTLSHVFPS